MMPGVDGFEFTRAVRELNEEIPILFMTARDDLASKQRGFRAGIDDYMVKPVDLDELLLRVEALLLVIGADAGCGRAQRLSEQRRDRADRQGIQSDLQAALLSEKDLYPLSAHG